MKSSDADPLPGIGTVAARFGLATHVLRHWETMGLLTPQRDSADRRKYSTDDIFRIAVILGAKDADFTLDEIRTMLTTTDPGARSTILRNRSDELRTRIALAQASLDLIDHAMACDHDDFTTCPNFRASVSKRLPR